MLLLQWSFSLWICKQKSGGLEKVKFGIDNSGVTGGGGQVPPQRLLTGQGKREKGEGENGEEKKENCNKEGGKLKWKDLFFFFLLFTFQNS